MKKKPNMTSLALTTSNAPWKYRLTINKLLEILNGTSEIGIYLANITVLLNEVHPSILTGLCEENNISIKQLSDLYFSLPEEFQSQQSSDFFKNGIIGSNYC